MLNCYLAVNCPKPTPSPHFGTFPEGSTTAPGGSNPQPPVNFYPAIGTVSVAGSPIKLQTSIKNLGVYLDSTMSFDKQVSETCKACFFHIRALRHIRASLTHANLYINPCKCGLIIVGTR